MLVPKNFFNYKWIIVQCISLLRVICALAFYCIIKRTGQSIIISPISLFLFIMIFVSDFLDGRMSRFWKVTSKFGSILDPICDKVAIYLLFLALYEKKPLVFYLTICKDILVVTGGCYTQYRFKKAILTTLGKSTMVFTGLLFMSIIIYHYYTYDYDASNFGICTTLNLLANLLHFFTILSISVYIVQYLYLFFKAIKSKKM